MKAGEWQQVKSLWEQALRVPEQERCRFVKEQTTDEAVCQEVLRLLEQNQDSDFLESRAWGSPQSTAIEHVFSQGQLLLERFEVMRFLGAGGMGEVYEALDRETKEHVALKTLRPELAAKPELIGRLRKELLMARKVQHPSICRLFDIHRMDAPQSAIYFVSMELLGGISLAEQIRVKTMPTGEVLPIAIQLASGLDAAHEAGVLHRDFKSGNVMLIPSVESKTGAVITDFGLSRDLEAGVRETISAFGPEAIVGTPAYMAPEQLRGDGASKSSDIYAFGVMLFEMVTGRLPFEGETPLAVSLQRLQSEAPEPKQFAPTLPRHWNQTIVSCLSAQAKHRPTSAQAVIDALEGRIAPLVSRRVMMRRSFAAAATIAAGAFVAYRVNQPKPVSQEAFSSLRRGDEFARRRNAESLENAIREYRHALQLEPNYAEAWAGLADCYAANGHYGFGDTRKSRLDARDAALQALKLNPRLAKAQGAFAFAESMNLSKWREAEPYFRKAIELDPGEPLTRAWFAAYLGRMQRFDEAIAQAKKAVELEPGAFYTNHQYTQEHFRARKFDEFYRLSQELVRLHPTEPSAYLSLARAAERQRKYEEALAACDEAVKYKNSPIAQCTRVTIQAVRGNMPEARRLLKPIEELLAKTKMESNIVSYMYAALGDYGKAMDVLEDGFSRDDATCLAALSAPYLDPIRDTPRFRALLKRAGFS